MVSALELFFFVMSIYKVHFCVFLQLLSHQEHTAESQEKQVNLKKDLGEMQEWMAQVDEEFLMRDFEYKSPEDLEVSLEEMKVGLVVSNFEELSLWFLFNPFLLSSGGTP